MTSMEIVPPARHLLRAKDLADSRYFESLGVNDFAHAARLSRADFSREFTQGAGAGGGLSRRRSSRCT
jgi:hypothetical protein